MQILRVWNRVNDLAKKDQSGYNTAAEFNDRIDQVQLEIVEKIYTYLGYTQRAADILAPFIKTVLLASSNTGVVTPPSDCLHYLSLSYQYTDPISGIRWIPCRQLDSNAVDLTAQNPVRNTNPAQNRVQYFNENNLTTICTNSSSQVKIRYVQRPAISQIAFTAQQSSGQYYQTYDPINSIDLLWNDAAFNLIVYLMLEKLGVEIREQFLVEFAQVLGIQREMIHKND